MAQCAVSGILKVVTALSRLVDAAMTKRRLSNRAVEELSAGCPDGKISQSIVGRYRRSAPANPTDRVLRVLSWTLEIPLPRMKKAAGVSESLGPWVPPVEAEQMTREQRDTVTRLIKWLAASQLTAQPSTDGAAVQPDDEEPVPDVHIDRIVDSCQTSQRRSHRSEGSS